ncbi:tripartite motif-containing protein 2-like [Ptychodera flava]|uniref:tripartite motif-containing protein 2-like n=1 Tax=Ptychodera flava TaxID=63121 RepID=UPI00396A1CEB
MAASVSQTTEELVQEINEDFLTCTICIERYERPKILPCHHVFCEKCLIRVVKKSDGYFDCPTCRMPCKLPDDGIEGLENNIFMNSLLEKMQKTPTESNESEENHIKCEICEDGDVTHICLDCQLQKFCEQCAKMHRKARIASKNTVFTLEQYKEEMSKNLSAVLPIQYFDTRKDNRANCVTCQVQICSECTVLEHPNKSHNCKLSADVRKLKEKADKIDESKRAAIKVLEFYNEKPKAEKAKITAKAADLITKITAEENSLKTEVTEEYDVSIKHQKIHNDDLHFRYGRIVSMINYLEFVSQHENATQLMSSEESVTECIRELEGLEQKPDIDHGEVDFVPAAKTESLVGELINITNESSVADPENKGPAATSKINVTVVNSRNVLKTESKPLGNNLEMAVLPDSVPKLINANFLICRVCFERFINPKILPCHHTFCEKCLHSLRKKSSNRLDCPSCKESYQLTNVGVSGFPNNIYLQSLSDTVPPTTNDYVVLNGICSICNIVKATHVCIWRQIDLCCSECSKAVKNTTKKTLATDECVLTIEEYKKFRSDDPTKVQTMSYCKNHKAYPINLYCNTCKSPICSACIESVHPKEEHTNYFS